MPSERPTTSKKHGSTTPDDYSADEFEKEEDRDSNVEDPSRISLTNKFHVALGSDDEDELDGLANTSKFGGASDQHRSSNPKRNDSFDNAFDDDEGENFVIEKQDKPRRVQWGQQSFGLQEQEEKPLPGRNNYSDMNREEVRDEEPIP